MKIIGLTGGIAMGKSTVAKQFQACGVPVYDADAAVHRLLGAGGGAVAPVAEKFGKEMIRAGGIDRRKLGRKVFEDPAALRALEAILHPRVKSEEINFIKRHRRRRSRLAVLEIPLLFETGGERRCKKVAVVTASPAAQRQRVLARPGMTEQKFSAIRARQMPDVEKRARADYLIYTGLGKAHSMRMVKTLVRRLGRKSRA